MEGDETSRWRVAQREVCMYAVDGSVGLGVRWSSERVESLGSTPTATSFAPFTTQPNNLIPS